jgi:hypothetical protein
LGDTHLRVGKDPKGFFCQGVQRRKLVMQYIYMVSQENAQGPPLKEIQVIVTFGPVFLSLMKKPPYMDRHCSKQK